ncbi:T9SS type A sorting domain-containing protein [candidate division KSB1 bacterium]|nr:T9SS type A sorting domain-containing protein [candidate division KSB1 bacterium]
MRFLINKAIIILIIFFQLTALSNLATGQIITTSEWVSFWSARTYFKGARIPLGAVIDAYDPDGVHCGTFTVKSVGQYGFLSVYRDDPFTPNVDEGASPGDTITFRINGKLANVLGPQPNVWTTSGDRLEVDLDTNVKPGVKNAMNDISLAEDDSVRIIADLDTVFYDPNDDTLFYSSQCNVPFVKDSIDIQNKLQLSLTPDWYGEAIMIICAENSFDRICDSLKILVKPRNDPPVITELPDIYFVNDTADTLALTHYVYDIDSPESLLVWNTTILSDLKDSLIIRIEKQNQTASFSAFHNYHGIASVLFTVTDESLATDKDTILVFVDRPSNINSVKISIPYAYFLYQNHPNPFNPHTTIKYQLPTAQEVKLAIYNLQGQCVTTLVNRKEEAGFYTITWCGLDELGNNVASGVYFYHFTAGKFKQQKKMVLMR